jgi:hypothetical protein
LLFFLVLARRLKNKIDLREKKHMSDFDDEVEIMTNDLCANRSFAAARLFCAGALLLILITSFLLS